MNKAKFTIADIEYISKHWQMDVKELAKHLGKTIRSVKAWLTKNQDKLVVPVVPPQPPEPKLPTVKDLIKHNTESPPDKDKPTKVAIMTQAASEMIDEQRKTRKKPTKHNASIYRMH